jgi:nicotinate phosphoribosyltransferase
MRERLNPAVFDLPIEKMKAGYYADAYFNHTRDILLKNFKHPEVVMQVFQRNHAVLGGIDEAIAILKLCSTALPGELEIRALYDGDEVEPWETVMTIKGDYTTFAHLETAYLGVLARRTLISTNVKKVCKAANGKPILFFPARHDHHLVQAGDGYAAHIAGAVGVSSDAQASWWGGTGLGTIPHSLIAAYGGDTVAAALAFANWAPEDMNIVVLTDFDNDVIGTSLAVANALGDRLWGVRIDTSGNLVDKSLIDEMGDFDPRGVNEVLVRKLRKELDRNRHSNVKIVVSGGFDINKITEFESKNVPVDSYGVGSSLIRGSNDFTADIVVTDGELSAKVGRKLRINPRLELVS